MVRCSRGFIRERDEWGRKHYVVPWRRDEEETGKEKVEIIVGLKEERKSIAFISYIVNLVSGSNDSWRVIVWNNRDGLSPSQTSSLPPACSPWSSEWPPTRSDPANQPTPGRLHVNDQASPSTLPKFFRAQRLSPARFAGPSVIANVEISVNGGIR